MISEYVLFMIVLPISILYKISFINKKDQILDKTDTIQLRGISAFFVIAAHYMTWVDNLCNNSTNEIVKAIVGQLGGVGIIKYALKIIKKYREELK